MRLLGIGCLMVIMAALTFLGVERGNVLVQGLFERNQPQEVASFGDQPDRSPQSVGLRPSVRPLGQNALPIMTGFPSFAELVFPIPKSATIKSATIAIVVNADLIAGASGHLVASIAGQKRGALALDDQRAGTALRIHLTASDLLKPSIHVKLRTEGVSPKPECAREWNGAVIVAIDHSTRLELELTEILSDPLERLMAWPERGVHWPAAGQRSAAFHFLANQEFLGGVQFSNAKHAEHLPRQQALEKPIALADLQADQNDFAQTLADLGYGPRSKEFHHSAEWQFNFGLRDWQSGVLPKGIALGLRYHGSRAQISVRLNGKINQTASLSQSGPARFEISFDPEDLGAQNTLLIKIGLDETQEGLCSIPRPKLAQIDPASSFTGWQVYQPKQDHAYDALLAGIVSIGAERVTSAVSANTALGLLRLLNHSSPIETTRVQMPNRAHIEVYELASEIIPANGWVIFVPGVDAAGQGLAVLKDTTPDLLRYLDQTGIHSVLHLTPTAPREAQL